MATNFRNNVTKNIGTVLQKMFDQMDDFNISISTGGIVLLSYTSPVHQHIHQFLTGSMENTCVAYRNIPTKSFNMRVGALIVIYGAAMIKLSADLGKANTSFGRNKIWRLCRM